ncbi:hypothetical protein JXB41_08730 [Candidatus Woesearchaeota archaeon]|nr:hypothetical protein [Candidatus Woesearchaeota archaeon]
MYDKSWDEQQHVIAGQQINYSGIFNYAELFKLIDRFFKKNSFEKLVLEDKEDITKKGKSIHIRLRPFKEFKGKSARLEVQLWITIDNMVDIVKKIDNKKIKLSKGNVNIVIDAFVLYNQRGKWECRAEYVFIRTIFDKFLMKSATKDYEGMVKETALELKNELNSFLNLNKFIY